MKPCHGTLSRLVIVDLDGVISGGRHRIARDPAEAAGPLARALS